MSILFALVIVLCAVSFAFKVFCASALLLLVVASVTIAAVAVIIK